MLISTRELIKTQALETQILHLLYVLSEADIAVLRLLRHHPLPA